MVLHPVHPVGQVLLRVLTTHNACIDLGEHMHDAELLTQALQAAAVLQFSMLLVDVQ